MRLTGGAAVATVRLVKSLDPRLISHIACCDSGIYVYVIYYRLDDVMKKIWW